MNEARWDDIGFVINYGLETQRNIADLNTITSDIIRKRKFDTVLAAFQEMLELAEQAGSGRLVENEQRLKELREEFTKQRIEILMEGKLLQELRHTNDAYIAKLKEEIREAQEYSGERYKSDSVRAALDHGLVVLNGRITEMITSTTVAESFSAQTEMSEKNCFNMADRIWNALVTILPLLEGRISMESSRTVITQTRELIMGNIREIGIRSRTEWI